MKKVFKTVLTIITCFTGLFTLIIFSISQITSPRITIKMVNAFPIQDLLKEMANNNAIYEQAKIYGISSVQIDTLLESKEASTFVNNIIQEMINTKTNQESLLDRSKIKDITEVFINNANQKYKLNLDNEEKEKLLEITSNEVSNESNQLLEIKFADEDKIIPILKICQSKKIQSTFLIIFFLELIFLIFLTYKDFAFLKSFATISLFLSINMLILTVTLQVIKILIKNMVITTILSPILQDGYFLTIILFITFIIFLSLYKIIKRKKSVPF